LAHVFLPVYFETLSAKRVRGEELHSLSDEILLLLLKEAIWLEMDTQFIDLILEEILRRDLQDVLLHEEQ
jgi:hypothetical protein